jgi:transcriptional regulator with XRE-family HTH domain
MLFPDDSQKDIAVVLSSMTARKLSREEVWKAMELPRSTYYDQLEKGTLITADNLRRAAANLGINRAELLTRYRLIEPEEVASLAAQMISAATEGGPSPLPFPPLRTGVTQAMRTHRKTGIIVSPRCHELSALILAC